MTAAVAAPSTPSFRARLHGVLGWLEAAIPLSAILLLARIGVAGTFFKSGLTKVDGDWNVTPLTVLLFRDEYRLPLLSPEFAAHAGTFFELVMPVLLVAGLFARLAALPLLGMTLAIQLFVYPDAWDTHGLWAAALLLIVARGPGLFSLDALFGIEKRKL